MTERDFKIPLKPFEEREPMSKYQQEELWDRYTWWKMTQCRVYKLCSNRDCQKAIRQYQYYYKYHNQAWRRIPWHFNQWKMICADCYYDHVCPPSSHEWQRNAERKMQEYQNTIEETYPEHFSQIEIGVSKEVTQK